MRAITYVFFILFSFNAISQETKQSNSFFKNPEQTDSLQSLKLFWGIPFGTSLQEVKSIKPQIVINDKKGVCIDCEFGSHMGFIGLQFNEDEKMTSGVVFIKPTDKELSFELYDNVVGNIERKYGKPSDRIEEFKYPFSDEGEGRKYPSLTIPTSKVFTLWKFKSSINHEFLASIIVNIERDYSVSIVYTDHYLDQGSENRILSDY